MGQPEFAVTRRGRRAHSRQPPSGVGPASTVPPQAPTCSRRPTELLDFVGGIFLREVPERFSDVGEERGSADTLPVLLGRDMEVSTLSAAVADAASGHGRPVMIEGAAGVGKSSLIAAAATHARASGLQVLTARGSEMEREFAEVGGQPIRVAADEH